MRFHRAPTPKPLGLWSALVPVVTLVCFLGLSFTLFGDGAINRGPFLEALNWARVYGLPVLFVCEDNRWSATTASGAMTAGDGAAARALSLDVPALQVDGNDVLAVHADESRFEMLTV